MKKDILYTMVKIDKERLLKLFPPIHVNVFTHHSTIEWKPEELTVPLGKEVNLTILGRLTNDKVDVLLVNNPWSKNKYPHITLSTADGVAAKQSNYYLEKDFYKIKEVQEKSVTGIITAAWIK
jgi:hypothetical protein